MTLVNVSYSGLIATMIDQAGKQRRQLADALGRTIRVDEPDATGNLGAVASPVQPTFYEYDGNDNLSKVTQTGSGATQERLFKYDSLSRLTHERQVEATATLNNLGVKVGAGGLWTGVYKYDADSLLQEGVDARGVKTAFTYDGLNRAKTVVYTGETGYNTPNVEYTYDEAETNFYNNGRLTKVKTFENAGQGTPETIQNYRYDKVGQVTKHIQSIGNQSYQLDYGYNLAGQLVSEKYPSGKIVNMTVDNFWRLSTVADSQRTYLSGITINSSGLLSQINLGNSTSETFSYNDRFQMTSQSLSRGAEVLQKYDYSYGTVDLANGNVNTAQNNGQLGKIEGTIGTNRQWSQRFGYDELGRLKEAREYKQGNNAQLTYKQVFNFDRFGNLYRKAASNPTAGQQNPIAYAPIEETTTPGTGDIEKATNRFRTGTTYDDAGQVVNDAKFRSMSFSYDANGRQIKASRASVPDAWTVYDALGNRVATKINDIWQYVIYDAFGKLVAEYGVASEGVGGVKYIQQDWQGSIRTVTNNNGFVVARTDHQAFGGEVGYGTGQRSIEQGYNLDKIARQGYGLTERDDATGLDHTWFRKNENQAGRWTSPDPYNGSMNLGDPQSFNRYSYVQPYEIGPRFWQCYLIPSGGGPTATVDVYGDGVGLIGAPDATINNTITRQRNPREAYVSNCLKDTVRDRVANLDRQRSRNLDLSIVGSMAPHPLPAPIPGLFNLSIFPDSISNDKDALGKTAIPNIIRDPLGTMANVLANGLREGTVGFFGHRQDLTNAKTITEEDRTNCENKANSQGF